jgi:hypothetical protein
MNLATAVNAVTEPQHGGNLHAHFEHGREWVVCNQCGRQWAIHGSDAEIVTIGDDFCDEQGDDYQAEATPVVSGSQSTYEPGTSAGCRWGKPDPKGPTDISRGCELTPERGSKNEAPARAYPKARMSIATKGIRTWIPMKH